LDLVLGTEEALIAVTTTFVMTRSITFVATVAMVAWPDTILTRGMVTRAATGTERSRHNAILLLPAAAGDCPHLRAGGEQEQASSWLASFSDVPQALTTVNGFWENREFLHITLHLPDAVDAGRR